MEQDPTLLHEEEAAQEPEQVGIQRRSGTGTEIDPAVSQVAVRARRMACEREATPRPRRGRARRAAGTIALGRPHANSEGRRPSRQERTVPLLRPRTRGGAETRDAEHDARDLDPRVRSANGHTFDRRIGRVELAAVQSRHDAGREVERALDGGAPPVGLPDRRE